MTIKYTNESSQQMYVEVYKSYYHIFYWIIEMILVFFLVPTPTVSVTAPKNQTVGQSLIVQCEVTTVRGITSRVDIVWSSDGTELVRIDNVLSTTMDNSLVYRGYYNVSQLSTTDDDRVIKCEVVINTSPLITSANNNITLSASGG